MYSNMLSVSFLLSRQKRKKKKKRGKTSKLISLIFFVGFLAIALSHLKIVFLPASCVKNPYTAKEID